MKKLNLLFVYLLILSILSSCSDDNDSKTYSLTVDKTSLTFNNAQELGSQSFSITSDADWVIDYVEGNWLELDKKSGKGNTRIDVAIIKKNYTDTTRIGKLNIKSPTGAFSERQVEIKQSGVNLSFNILTAIPDENFKAYIQDWLFMGKDFLTIKDAQEIKILIMENRSIKSIEGISFFSNLEIFQVSFDQITTADVSNLIHLKELYLPANKLETLDVSNLTKLEKLSFASNQLTSINLSNLTKLKILYCGSNNLISLDLSKLVNLNAIYCYKNKLVELDISSLKNLRYLDCRINQLTVLNLSNLTELERVSCGGNKLTSLTLSNLTKLESISCERNKLTTLDISDLPKLENLLCFDNAFTPKSVKISKRLQESKNLSPSADSDIYDWVSN